jgi:broad specificity phosphatase PhoE
LIPFPLIFIRHGETDWNRVGRLQGQKDIPLNDHGRRQAARNGRALAGILASRPWQMQVSPLGRAMETMQIVLAEAGKAGDTCTRDPRLMEVGYGRWEGRTLPELALEAPQDVAAREADKWRFVPPQGESYADLADRILTWVADLREPSVVVAHGGVMRVLMHILAGLPPHDAPHLAAPQDRVLIFTGRVVATI